MATINASSLNSTAFKKDYGLKHAYLAGAMYKGIVEAAAFVQMAPSLERYRLQGLQRDTQGKPVIPPRILAKVL